MIVRVVVISLLCFFLAAQSHNALGKKNAPNYSFTFRRLNQQEPCVNFLQGDSVYMWNYNTAVVPIKNDTFALLVRCQNQSNPNDPYSVTQSVMAYTPLIGPFNPEVVKFEVISHSSVVFYPQEVYESYGTEDPRIVYNPADGLYYLLYSAVQQYSNGTIISRLALATSRDPSNPNGWTRHGPLFESFGWSKSGALLIRPSPPHYLIFGDSNLNLATSNDLLNWNIVKTDFLSTRPDHFDSALVESGPYPAQLSDGNYLFIHNSARGGYPSKKPGWDLQYNVGWLILDGNDPSKILQRSESPILSPQLAWEMGTAPFLGLTPNVVFIEGWIPSDKPDSFIVFYGGADSVVGVGEITVSIN